MHQPREQEFPVLLFNLTPVDPQVGTPRSVTPHRTGPESSFSTQKRSGGTPASIQTEATPPPLPPPPPVVRLTDDIYMEDPARPGPHHAPASPAPRAPSSLPAGEQGIQPMSYDALTSHFEDVWVTVFGFSPSDVPLILKEFSRCGDVLQWGTYGQAQANFLHIQYQNKYAAQRALLRNGELLSSSMIIGVKPLDPRHRAAAEGYDALQGSPSQMMQPKPAPERPYRVEMGMQAQQMPQPSRNMLSKVAQYVFGV